MKIIMTFKAEKLIDESLADFRKRLEAFKSHVAALQIKGTLPRGEVYWIVGNRKEKEPIALPPPREQLMLPPCLHTSGSQLDV